MNDVSAIVKSPEKLLKAIEVAEILSVSRAFAYQLMRQGEIPSIRIGRSVRVRRQDLAAYIDENAQSSNCEFVLK